MADGSMNLLCDADVIRSGRVTKSVLESSIEPGHAALVLARAEEPHIGEYCGVDLPPFDGTKIGLGVHPDDRELTSIAEMADVAMISVGDSYDSLLGWGLEALPDDMKDYLRSFTARLFEAVGHPVTVGYLQVWDGGDYENTPRFSRREFQSLEKWLDAEIIPYCVTLFRPA